MGCESLGFWQDYVRFDDSLSGYLVLSSALDYEKVHRFNVTISARDQGSPPLSATTSIEIDVEGVFSMSYNRLSRVFSIVS